MFHGMFYDQQVCIKKFNEVLDGLVVSKFGHLIKGCHLCVASSPTSGNPEDLSHYDPGW